MPADRGRCDSQVVSWRRFLRREQGEFVSLRKFRCTKSMMIILYIFLILVAAAAWVGSHFVPPEIPGWITWSALALIWALCLFGLIYFGFYFTGIVYEVSERELIRSSGVFIRNRRVIKMEAIQYTTTITFPFNRITGINFLVIHGLGGSLLFSWLKKSDIQQIKQMLPKNVVG